MTRIYLPPDANCAVSVIDHCLRSKDYVNLVCNDSTLASGFTNSFLL